MARLAVAGDRRGNADRFCIGSNMTTIAEWIASQPNHRDVEQRPLGSPLFHYTSLETMEKILRTRVMHASHVAYMNDGSELELGMGMLKSLLRKSIRCLSNIRLCLSCALAKRRICSANGNNTLRTGAVFRSDLITIPS